MQPRQKKIPIIITFIPFILISNARMRGFAPLDPLVSMPSLAYVKGPSFFLVFTSGNAIFFIVIVLLGHIAHYH